jgi:NADP-dependent 3-hydroxy acid dehydrogenase YdfG
MSRSRHDRPQVVVVTGASAGVGRAVAHAFAADGARVGLIARAAESLDAACREVERLGGAALACPADVADAVQVEAAAAAVEARFGPIDVWVNAAMATVFAPLQQIEPAEFERATHVTYLGTVHGTMAALRRMRERDRGVVVQVGSAVAYRAIPLQSAYAGAKFAVRGFTDAVRTELMHDHRRVRITMVQLPALNTPQFDWCLSRLPLRPQPVAPIFQPEVAARAVRWAARHRRRELRVGASSVRAIVGTKLAPALGDRYLARTGYDAQQVEGALADPERPSNLFEPVPGPAATHGAFDARARRRSGQLWAATHRAALGAALGAAAAAGWALARRW